MKFMIPLFLFASAAFAAGAQKFDGVATLQKTNFYRLTCSDTSKEGHVHFYAEVNKGKVENAKLVTLVPALSLLVISFEKEEAGFLALDVKSNTLAIEGSVPGSYFNQDLKLEIADYGSGLTGTLSYNDNDGSSFERKVECGAVNYILHLNQ